MIYSCRIICFSIFVLPFLKCLEWSQLYASRDEILRYIKDIASKRNLYSQTRLETKVIKSQWLKGCRKWKLDILDCGESYKALESEFFDFVYVIHLFYYHYYYVCRYPIFEEPDRK